MDGVNDLLQFGQQVLQTMLRNRAALDMFNPKGRFHVEHIRDGKVINTYDFPNDITNQGKNDIFDTMFHDATQIAASAWAIGLISNAGYSALAPADTMASHSGWAEFGGYTQSNRPAWGPGAATGQAITNASPVTFDINATGTVKGVFVTSNNTKAGTAGRLWATALFNADVPVSSGDQLRVTYSVSA
jgi:hypothetical protein